MNVDGARVFRVGACVGRGGFGEVYRATLRSSGGLESKVALKVLRADPSGSDAATRFRDEGRMLSRLQHPAVVRAFDWARLEGVTALVTEYVDGFDLSRARGTIPLRPLLETLAQVASALDAAYHTVGPTGLPLRIVHRDLKPSNIRLGKHGQVKLLDFGIAVLGTADRESRTETELLVGSLHYLAPERFTERRAQPAVDVYGLGCVAFELLAGDHVLPGLKLRELSGLALDRAAWDARIDARVAELPATVPKEVRALVRACLSHDPAARPAPEALAREAEGIARDTDGPTLRRWCAEASFPEPPLEPGPWTDRELVEGAEAVAVPDRGRPTVVRSAAETVALASPPPARGPGLGTVAALGCLFAASAGAIALGLGGLVGAFLLG